MPPPKPPVPPGAAARQATQAKRKSRKDSDDEDEEEVAPGEASPMEDTSEEDEEDSDEEDDDAEAYEDDEDEEDEEDDDEDSDEDDKPVGQRLDKRQRTHQGTSSTVSSVSSSSQATVVPAPQPVALLGVELQELTGPVRARVSKWQERSALGLSTTARERIDQYVQVLATGTSSLGMLSASLSLNDELLARLEDTAQPAASLSQVERDNVQKMSHAADAFAKGTLGRVRDALEESKRTTATLETVLENGESVLKTNVAVLEALARKTAGGAPGSSQPVA